MQAATPSPDRLPTFFVIGAPKCGTTSLHRYLDVHPQIAMTAEKEPFVFVAADWRRRLATYDSLFRSDAEARGESSTVYSQYPEYAGVPERIREAVPDARFVYLVGDPIERAIAHYRQHVVDGKESRPLGEAFADFGEPGSLYLSASRYATQLGRYLSCFPRERILVVDRDELLTRRGPVLEAIFEFVGVERGFRSPEFDRRLNRAEDQRVPTGLGRRLGSTRALGALRAFPLPRVVRGPLGRLLSRPPGRERLEEGLRRRIAASLADEVAWLREFTGMEFAGWSL